MIRTALLAVLFSTAAVAQTTSTTGDTPVDTNIAGHTATIIGLDGANAGRATIRRTPSGFMLATVSLTGVPQGWHSVHVHETGECDPTTGFKSAGGHLADGKDHGVLADNGPHPGDFPNQMVQEGGILVAELMNDRLSEDMLFDADGSAWVIHSGRDDYQSQPSGAAGDRLYCGVIERAQ